MIQFKRNQVDEAISSVLDQTGRSHRTIRTQIKRLLETDRALPISGENYAFFSEAPPGSGVEIWFTEYEAFALLVALALMVHHWPQSFVVAVMRQVRNELEEHHAEVLMLDEKWLFAKEAASEWLESGEPPFDNRRPSVLTIVAYRNLAKGEHSAPYKCGVRRTMAEATKFANASSPLGGAAWSFFDATPSAFQISKALKLTEPRIRGRG